MFIAIQHEIHDPSGFQTCAERVFPLPEGLQLHQFLPAPDQRKAACLYEAPSVAALRAHIDGTLGETSSQHYFPIDEGQAIGLPGYSNS